MSDVNTTIDTLRDAFKKQGEQLLGNEDTTSFLETLGDYDSLDDLLDDLFNTDDYNEKWIKLVNDKDKDEKKDGPRYRLIIGFLAAWKKALIRACTKRTDVDTVFNDDVGFINSGINSLDVTKLKVAAPETTGNEGSGSSGGL